MVFFYGPHQSPTQKAVITDEGAFGIGTTPDGSTMLALEDDERALLVPRVASLDLVTTPVDGMLVYLSQADNHCFRFYQGGAWSECLGVADKIRISSTIPDNQGLVGDIYFNDDLNTLLIHDGTQFVHLGQPLVKVGTGLPPVGTATEGDIFFNQTNNRLYVFNGTTWVDVSYSFQGLMSYHTNCTRMNVRRGERDFTCPDNKLVTALYFEPSVGRNQIDSLNPPEIGGVECCEVTFDAYYWSTTPWDSCTLAAGESCGVGVQNREVSCLRADGVVAPRGDGDCAMDHRPSPSRTCIDNPCTSWYEEPWDDAMPCVATSNSSATGLQTRDVHCEDGAGNTVPDNQCQGAKPNANRSCTIPTPSNNLECATNGWLDHGTNHPGPSSNGGTSDPYGSGPMRVDWSRCDKQEYTDNGHSKTHTVYFDNPPRSGQVLLHIHRDRTGQSHGTGTIFWWDNAEITISGQPIRLGSAKIDHKYFRCNYAPNPSGPDYSCSQYTP